jgi:cytochrome P450
MNTAEPSQDAARATSPKEGRKRGIADLPGPKGIPLLGNARQINSAQFHSTLEAWAREFGPFYKFRISGRQFVVTADSDVIAGLLRDRPDALRRSSRMARMLEEQGTCGVFTAEGEEWRRQRKLVMRALTPEVIHNFFPTLAAMTERLRHRWQDAAAADNAIDVLRDLKAYTLDVTIALAMGRDIDALEHEDNPLQRDIEFSFNRIARRLTMPFAYWRYFKLPVDRDADARTERIRQVASGFVALARKRLEDNTDLRLKPSNLLEALVAARDEPGSGFSDSNVIGNAVTMVFAGEDTTSNTIAWLLYFLARWPPAAARAAAEADEALADAKVPDDLRKLDRLPYIEAATREAMRLKPVAPFLALEANREIAIENTSIPKGTLIILLLRHSAERNTEWEQPGEFRPERWLSPQEPEVAAGDSSRKLFPFGGGPRFCPGRYLAMAEIKMVMAMLVKNFRLELIENAPPVEEHFTFNMTPGSLPVRLKSRTGS